MGSLQLRRNRGPWSDGVPEPGACPVKGARWLCLFSGSAGLYRVSLRTLPAPGGVVVGNQLIGSGLNGLNSRPSQACTSPPPTNHPSKVGIRSCYPDTFPTLFAVRACIPCTSSLYLTACIALLQLQGSLYIENPGASIAHKSRHDATAQPNHPAQSSVARHGHER